MGKYTIETLAEINAEYLMENYKILQTDINMVNEYVDMIERTRSTRETKTRGHHLLHSSKRGILSAGTYRAYCGWESLCVRAGRSTYQ